MAKDRRDLEGVWKVLTSAGPTVGIAAAPIGVDVAAGELLAGIDSEGRRHILIPLGPGEAARTYMKGRGVQLTRVSQGGVSYLTVFCLLPELHPVFTQFCRELVESVESASSPAREAAEAFDRWRQLFSDAAMGGNLSEEALVGLIGELLALQDLLARGASPSLEYWEGPLGRVHDFRIAGHAIEVKATLTREGRVVQISNVDQLQPPPGCDLVLRHVRLDHDPGGFSLEDLVEEIRTAGANTDTLSALLRKLDVSPEHLGVYSGRRYRVTETRHYDVTTPAFPRIVRSSFNGGDVPPGTLHVRFAIDLTNEPPLPLTDSATETVLATFAIEAGHGLDS